MLFRPTFPAPWLVLLAFALLVLVLRAFQHDFRILPLPITQSSEASTSPPDKSSSPQQLVTEPETSTVTKSQLPIDYANDPINLPGTSSGFCSDLFGLDYVYNLAGNRESYCPDQAPASMTCGWVRIIPERKDYYCVAEKAAFHRKQGKFQLGCSPDPSLWLLPRQIYDTGIPNVLDHYFGRAGGDGSLTKETDTCEGKQSDRIAVLIKRELHKNLWHTLMEVMAYYVTMDVMRVEDPSRPPNDPLHLSADDLARTQIILLDDMELGPFADLWSMFSKYPVVKLSDYKKSGLRAPNIDCYDRVIIPMPGGSFPVWQGDWKPHSCHDSAVLAVMRDRILDHFKIPLAPTAESTAEKEITVTFIDRQGNRVLRNQKSLIDRLRKDYPTIKIQAIDFASLTFKQQIELVRTTNILVGTHGAGLTHLLFLPERSNVVEIQAPNLKYHGFHNLAGLMGHRYFSTEVTAIDGGDWHWAKWMEVNEEKFMRVMDAAVRSMFFYGDGRLIE